MADITNSSILSGKEDRCLVCYSAYPKVSLSTSNTNSTNAATDYDSNKLTKATEKIFEYLLVPKEQLANFKKKKCNLPLCPNCMVIVKEIMELQNKIDILELQIKHKVETLGRIVIDTSEKPVFTACIEKDKIEVVQVLRIPVTQNVRKGLLPDPLGEAGNKDHLTSFQKPTTLKSKSSYNRSSTAIETTTGDDGSFSKSNTYIHTEFPSSNCNTPEECVRSETDETIVKVEAEEGIPNDLDSNGDLFDVVTVLVDADPKPTSETHKGQKRRKLDNAPTTKKTRNIKYFKKETRIACRNELHCKKELDGLTEGQDYFKCTKCDFVAKNKPDSSHSEIKRRSPRQRVADHYSGFHNPVRRNEISANTTDGKHCYKCTKCTFAVVFQSNSSEPDYMDHLRLCYSQLSSHYMVHDILERRDEHEIKLASLPDGGFTFLCPIPNCNFVALIPKADTQKQQLNYGIKARYNLIEHYRTSEVHLDERENTLSKILNTLLVFEAVGVSFYKCTKCDFKGYAENFDKNVIISNPRETVRKALIAHYLHEHVFPWDKFPGFYKYGCYEDKRDDGNVLKCFYSDCDYFIKIQYDLEGETEFKKQCQQAAYQSFVDNHAMNHHFNSVGLENDKIPAKPAEDTLSVESVQNSQCSRSQRNAEGVGVNENVMFRSSIATTNQFHDLNYEEVTIKNEMWVGDFEEVEEMNPAIDNEEEFSMLPNDS